MREVRFYRTEKGFCPIEEFIDSLTEKAAQKVVAVLKLIESQDRVSAKFFKKLSGTEIWECRIMWQSDIYRLFGFISKGKVVILTHGFQKKTQKTPKAEIQRAEIAMKDFCARNYNE